MYINYSSRNGGGGGFNLGCLIFGILGMVALFYIVKGIFTLLWWAAPVLFLATLVIDWRVVSDAGKGFVRLISSNPLAGLLTLGLGIIGFPVLVLLLFLTALGKRRLGQAGIPWMQQNRRDKPDNRQFSDEFVEFEEIESRPIQKQAPPTTIVIPPPPEAEKEKPAKPENPYKGLFEE
jgi:hypothetical protein